VHLRALRSRADRGSEDDVQGTAGDGKGDDWCSSEQHDRRHDRETTGSERQGIEELDEDDERREEQGHQGREHEDGQSGQFIRYRRNRGDAKGNDRGFQGNREAEAEHQHAGRAEGDAKGSYAISGTFTCLLDTACSELWTSRSSAPWLVRAATPADRVHILGRPLALDERRKQAAEEANAIGTAYLRIDLLPQSAQLPLRETFASTSMRAFNRARAHVSVLVNLTPE
jgi:hypothetical protein